MQDATRTFEFDPANIERLFLQDAIAEDHGLYPWWPSKPIWDRNQRPIVANIEYDTAADGRILLVWQPDFDGWYKLDLPTFIKDLRNAVLLPFCAEFMAWLERLLECAEREQFVRTAHERERAIRVVRYGADDWAAADLLVEVERVCGMGRKMGGEHWFHCPFHEDRDPSLEVNPDKRVWHCWGCGKAGGVYDWRKRV